MVFLLLMIQPVFSVWAESGVKEITMTTEEAIKLAGNLVERGDFEHAHQILTKMPKMNNLAFEIERWFLLG